MTRSFVDIQSFFVKAVSCTSQTHTNMVREYSTSDVNLNEELRSEVDVMRPFYAFVEAVFCV